MDGRPRSRWVSALVLLVCAAPPAAEAQQFVCSPIAAGETAASLARLLTGDAESVYQHSFQIRDPARRMFVPKSHYRRLNPDWQACVATARLTDTPPAYSPVVAMATRTIALAEPAERTPPVRDEWREGLVLALTIASAVSLMLLIIAAVAELRPRRMPPAMRRAGEEFVHAFARPLMDSSSTVPPIQARLRFNRRSRQLEISIAPGAGRRYPNLIDHRTNVEYDVHRVMRILGARFVVGDRLRAEGPWVVVPIQLADVKRTGAR